MPATDPWSLDDPADSKKTSAPKSGKRRLPPWLAPAAFVVGVVAVFGVLLFSFFRSADGPGSTGAAGVPTTNPAITYVEDEHDHEAEEAAAAAAATSSAFDQHELESPEEAGLPVEGPTDPYPTVSAAPEEGYEHDHEADETAWRTVAEGFGVAYGNTAVGPEVWIEGLRPYLTEDLVSALTGSGDFDGGVPKSYTVQTDGGIAFQDVVIRYDNSSLDLVVELLNQGDGWIVTSIDQAQ